MRIFFAIHLFVYVFCSCSRAHEPDDRPDESFKTTIRQDSNLLFKTTELGSTRIVSLRNLNADTLWIYYDPSDFNDPIESFRKTMFERKTPDGILLFNYLLDGNVFWKKSFNGGSIKKLQPDSSFSLIFLPLGNESVSDYVSHIVAISQQELCDSFPLFQKFNRYFDENAFLNANYAIAYRTDSTR